MKAKEFLKNTKHKSNINNVPYYHPITIRKVMIEFAKYHVEKALLKAEGEAPYHCSEGIKNCYSLENIK